MNTINSSKKTMPFGFALVNNDYIVQFLNDNFSKILQYSKESMMNKDLSLFIPHIKSYNLEQECKIIKLRTSLGQYVDVEIVNISNSINNNYIIFCYDFSKYEELPKQLNESNEKIYLYQSLLNSLQDGIFLTDDKGKTLFVNDAFLSLSNLKRSEVIGKTVYYLMSHKIVPNSCCAKVLETKSPCSTLNHYFHGKSCLVSGSPVLDSNNQLKMVVSVIRDVSELELLRQNLESEKSLALSYKAKLKQLEEINNSEPLVTKSKVMSEIYDKALKVANIDSSILILGETGVGKDFLAQYIHKISKRGEEGPFLKINCGAIPEQLLESELFGYEAGAFTGASRSGKAGLFELANNGTLFLDEIGDMPYNLQVKLLSALQDKKMYRIGGNKVINFNCRIIAATNADLAELVKQKKFRIDLYYRLNVINISIPPLKYRKEDIIPLAMEFLNQFNEEYGTIKYFASRTLELFLIYDWPGNIREMKNLVERLIVISDKNCIEPEVFYEQVLDKSKINYDSFFIRGSSIDNEGKPTLKQKLESYEAHIIKESIDKFRTLKEASDYLDIDISTLVRKKKKYNI